MTEDESFKDRGIEMTLLEIKKDVKSIVKFIESLKMRIEDSNVIFEKHEPESETY